MFSLFAHLRRAAVAAGLLIAAATGADAQAPAAPPVGVLRFDVAGAPAFTSPWGPADVGRLRGTLLSAPNLPGAQRALDLYCVDVLHAVSFDPAGWSVYMTNLGGSSVDFTRQGARYATGTPDALTRYRKAAWLVDQFASVTTLADTAGIQGAMWRQFESSIAPFTYANAAEETAVTSWTSAADMFAASSAFASYDWSQFTVLTDVNAAGLGDDYRGYQELITRTSLAGTVVPEPSTVMLLGVSLAALGAGAAARRRRGDDTQR